jgi:hypothetical protein
VAMAAGTSHTSVSRAASEDNARHILAKNALIILGFSDDIDLLFV